MTGSRTIKILLAANSDSPERIIGDWLVTAAAMEGIGCSVLPANPGGQNEGYLVVLRLPDDATDSTASSLASGQMDEDSAVQGSCVDCVIASDRSTLARAISAGWVDKKRSTVIANFGQSFSAREKQQPPAVVASQHDLEELVDSHCAKWSGVNIREIAGWYRLPEGVSPSILFGAMFGAGAIPFTRERCVAAIEAFGVEVDRHKVGFRKAIAIGRRGGGRARRQMTVSQFLRRKSTALPRDRRQAFAEEVAKLDSALTKRLGEGSSSAAREVLFRLYQKDSQELVDAYQASISRLVNAVPASAMQSSSFDIDEFTRLCSDSLGAILDQSGIREVARFKLSAERIRALRKRHGIARSESFSLIEWLPTTAADGSVTVRRVNATSVGGAFVLRGLAGRRRGAAKALDKKLIEHSIRVARTYAQAVIDLLSLHQGDLAMRVAATGLIVQGSGKTREALLETGEALWGGIVSQSCSIDALAPVGSEKVSVRIVSKVLAELRASGSVSLWEYVPKILGIAMHRSRGGSHEEALAFAGRL